MSGETCEDCGRPVATSDNVPTSDQCGALNWGTHRAVTCLRVQLANTRAQLAEAQRENAAWRALAEWESAPVHCRSVVWEPVRSDSGDDFWVQTMDEHDQTERGEGPTVQAAAIELAIKLNLLTKEPK